MSRALFTIAYPDLTAAGADWIRSIRITPTPDIAPHFTLAFGTTDLAEHAYLAHVAGVAARHDPIRFHCRRVVLGADHRDETGYAFLIPDEGASGFHRLHDALCSGPLAAARDLNVAFTPHLTLGQFQTTTIAKAWCDCLNQQPISISGHTTRLTVVARGDHVIEEIASFDLSPHGSAA